MKIEYHLTYLKKYSDEHPHGSFHKVYPSYEHALLIHNKMLEWQKRVPSIDLQGLKITKRLYTEVDVTPKQDG